MNIEHPSLMIPAVPGWWAIFQSPPPLDADPWAERVIAWACHSVSAFSDEARYAGIALHTNSDEPTDCSADETFVCYAHEADEWPPGYEGLRPHGAADV